MRKWSPVLPPATLALLVALTSAGLPGCDSSTAYQADLGQAGTLPALSATLGAPSSAGTPVTFSAPPGGALPSDWSAAQSLKLYLSGQQLPLAPGPGGYTTLVPAQLGFTPPLNGTTVPMPFVVNGAHTEVAQVTFH